MIIKNKKPIVDIIQLVHGWAIENMNGPERGRIVIYKNLMDALIRRSNINDDMFEPFDYWLIDGFWVREPSIAGKVIGGLDGIIIKNKSVLRMSQASFNHLLANEKIELKK